MAETTSDPDLLAGTGHTGRGADHAHPGTCHQDCNFGDRCRCDPYCVDGYCRSGDAGERTSVVLINVVRESPRKCMGILLPVGVVYWIRMRGPTSRIGWINKELCNEQDVPIVYISK